MKCSHRREDCGIVIRFDGELGHHEAAQCVEYLEKTMILYATEPIYLDLSGLTFMDSTGIGMLIGRYKKLKNFGIPVYLAGANNGIEKVIELSGLYGIMPKY